MIAAPVLSRFMSQKFVAFIAKMSKEDLAIMGQLIAIGRVRPVIDKRYRLGQASEAIRYLEQGHARGKVVMTLES
jgi:NADPH:quinone reductase-like Zn-dependent oxidoreductase